MIAECWKAIYWEGESAETMPDMRPWHVKALRFWLATVAAIPCAVTEFVWRLL